MVKTERTVENPSVLCGTHTAGQYILFLLYFPLIYYLYIYISSQLIQLTFMLTGLLDEKRAYWTGNIHSIEIIAITFPSKYFL